MSDKEDKAVIAFDDEIKKDDKKEGSIEDEIAVIIKSADSLIEILEKLAPEVNSDKVVNPEAFLKIIKPLCINVENTLPLLNECVDNLEYLKDEEAASAIRQKIAHIEDDLLPPIIEYVRKHEAKSK